jgi:hypothetical protein
VREASAFEVSRLEVIEARYALGMLAIVRPHWEGDAIGGGPLVWLRGWARPFSRGLLQLSLLRLLLVWVSILRVLVLRLSGLPVPQRRFRRLRLFQRDDNVRLIRDCDGQGCHGGSRYVWNVSLLEDGKCNDARAK